MSGRNKTGKKRNKLNLGCGKDIRRNYVNVDIIDNERVDLVHDLNSLPLPFENNSFEEILLQDVLEHLDNRVEFMEEIYRISKSEALIKIRVPHFTSRNVWGDLEHKRGFNWDSFELKGRLEGKFKILNRKITFSKRKPLVGKIVNLVPRLWESWIRWPSAANIKFLLKVKK